MKALSDISDHPAHILVVDDELQNRELLEVMLAPEGYVVQMATSGEEALAMVAKEPPDLVVLDVMMPGLDGYAVTQRLKVGRATKGIPVMLVTALDDRRSRMLGLEAGAEDFLSKPVDRSELRVRVRNLLRLKAYGDYHSKYGEMLEGEVGSRAAALLESERLYRSTFDAAPIGIAHVGLDGCWLRVNERLSRLLGYSREELQSIAAPALIRSVDTPDDIEAFRKLAAGTLDRYVIDEKRYQARDSTAVWARVNVSAYRDSEGEPRYFILVIEDITERRMLEAQLRQASKMDAIGGLATGIAHDFNNLLSVILSYGQLLADDLQDGDPMRADLNEIRGAGLRAVNLTRQLLAFSRQQVLEPQILDLGEIVQGVEKMLGRLIGEHIELSTVSSPALRAVLVDPGQVEQVIMNLAVNARDAMPRGGKLTIETADVVLDEAYAASHVGVKPGAHVMLTMTDNGVGMNKETQARMFEPFFTTKEVGRGTGLGLATVFGIVRQSGASIWVWSRPGEGTTFKIYFPAAEGTRTPRVTALPADGRTLRGSETVLLVEDEELVRNLARTILQRYGYTVLDAQNGGDAFLLCEQYRGAIDLLLTDVVMPRMSGQQLAERLLKIRPAMRVLYMSGYANDELMRNGIPDSTIALLQKPITPDVLARKVREVLAPAGAGAFE